jgi:deoxyribose-phosphate aldolase
MAPNSKLTQSELVKLFDHTFLKAHGSEKDISKLCDEALEYGFYSVCILPRWIPFAKKRLENSEVKIATVVGFPLGGNTLESKIFETQDALAKGAHEIDMVIDSGAFKSGQKNVVQLEIEKLQNQVTSHKALLKVILETSHWNTSEISELTQRVCDAGAAFVKTSTGFGARGASPEDIKTMFQVTSKTKTQIKASGGLKSLESVLELYSLGATRIGSSSSCEIVREYIQKYE